MDRFFTWLIRKIGIGALLSFSLLVSVMSLAAFGLAELILGIDDAFLWPAILLGTLIGWLLGRSSLPGWKSALLGTFLVLTINLFHFGQLAGPLVALASNLGSLILAALRWRSDPRRDSGIL